MNGLFDDDYDSPTPQAKGNSLTEAQKAYQALEVQQLAKRVIRQAGRSASPEFLKAVGLAVAAHADGKGKAR